MKHALLLLLVAASALADIRLPALLSDNMVLQQQRPVRIWGKATPGEAITVSMAGQKVEGEPMATGSGRSSSRPWPPVAPMT